MDKQTLRTIYRAKRAAIPGRDKLRYDDLLLLQFQQLNYSGLETLFTYWPMAATAEPNTHLFTGYLRHMVEGLQIVYPKLQQGSDNMEAIRVHEETVYTTNTWGITEPKSGPVADPEQIDLVFVPMLACDRQGHRVGYGRGYYDRYLARCRKDVVTIGFSYFEPVEQISDTDHFDVPLQYCITPQAIYEF